MDTYLTSFALGGVGLVAMALGGIVREGHGHGGHGHSSHGHAGHGHAGHGHAGDHGGHGGHGGHGHGGHHAHQDHHGVHGAAHGSHEPHGASAALLALMSPRLLFSLALGFGASGLLLRTVSAGRLAGLALLALALVGALLFEKLLVSPLWRLLFRFASNPALTLESAIAGDATAVTSFDANGQGIVAIEMDGQVVQLLATLDRVGRELRVRVPAGARLRVEDVDVARNRCSVSLL